MTGPSNLRSLTRQECSWPDQIVGQLDPTALQGLARGDAWRASFDGTAKFCASDDRTEFATVGNL